MSAGRLGKLAGLAVVVFAALAGPALAEVVTLSGTVTYRERIALPEGGSLRIRLVDMTADGTPTRVEAEAPIQMPGQVPLAFTLSFDDRELDPAHSHALIAEISSGATLWFRNAEPFPVTTLPPSGPTEITATFVGRLVSPGESGADATESAGLIDTAWQATDIGGDAVDPRIDSTLTIGADMRAGGRGGCNSYFSQATIAGSSIHFSAVASTRMACLSESATTQETAFFIALAGARSWQLETDDLVLLDEDGNEVVRFAPMVR